MRYGLNFYMVLFRRAKTFRDLKLNLTKYTDCQRVCWSLSGRGQHGDESWWFIKYWSLYNNYQLFKTVDPPWSLRSRCIKSNFITPVFRKYILSSKQTFPFAALVLLQMNSILSCVLTVPSPMSATSQCSIGVLPICANTTVLFSERKTSCGWNIFTGPPGRMALAFGFRDEALFTAVASVSFVLDPQPFSSPATASPR